MNRSALSLSACVVLASVTLAGEPEKKCCFKNNRYAGACEVTPAEGETCKSILEYLNNPNSTGKAYCGGTAIRGGWGSATCKAAR
jgi:hypothetical protein